MNKMNYFNIKQDLYKRWVGLALSSIMIFGGVTALSAQNNGKSCITIPFASNNLIQINKADGTETVLGSIGVNKVQALALNPTADTIYAARPGQLGILTFSDTKFSPLPQPFGTGDGALGSIDFIEVEGLTVDLADNTLFASVKVQEPGMDVLIKVNPETGSFIADAFGTGVDYVVISGPGVFSIIEDIAVNPRDGQMYGLAREELGNDVLIRINKQDGTSEVIGPLGVDILEGLGFDIKGNLYATPGFNTTPPSRFFSMDTNTGQASAIGELVTSADYESCDCLYVNSNPDAGDDQFETPEGQQLTIDAPGVLENDSDPDDDEIVIISFDTTTIKGGQVMVNPDGSFSYSPPVGFEGVDTFTYIIEDELQATDSAIVYVIVGNVPNNDPMAGDDNFATDIGTALEVDAPGVLANDVDPDGDILEIIAHDTTSIEGGIVALNPDGSLVYTPVDGFEGEDSFNYVISDGRGGTDTAVVNVAVGKSIKGADAPSANDDSYSTDQNNTLEIQAPGVLANDTDPNGDDLTIVDYDEVGTNGGEVMLNPDGSFVFTPAIDSVGTDTFTYVVSDPDGNTDTASVTIVVNEVIPQNSPPIAQDDEYMTDQDTELLVEDPAEGILANDSDPDGDEIAALEITDGITDQGGRITINGDGTFTYVPRAGFVGRDSYEYTVCDDQEPILCDSAMIYIEVKELPVEVFNAFSPNGDGINDTWVIQGISRFPDNEVRVYNRWGNLIFEGLGYDNATVVWNGESSEGVVFGGNDAPDGAYYYVIDLGDGSESLKGFVVLRR
jgi:gliding motility-associated-like protein